MSESSIVGVAAAGGTDITAASTSYYGPFGGQYVDVSLNTTEANAQLKFRGAGTLQNMQVTCNTNGRSTNSTVTARKNGADTALSVSITASTTGTFTDLTHTATYADADLWNYAVATGTGAGSLRVLGVIAELVCTTQAFTQLASFGALALTAGPRYFTLGGEIKQSSVESVCQMKALEAATLSNMQTVVSANASTGYTMTSRKNGAAGGQSISVGSGLTGFFEDVSGTDVLALGDTFGVSVQTAPSASVTVQVAAIKYTGASAGRAVVSAASPQQTLGAASTRYSALFGATIPTTTESIAQLPAPFAGTASALSCHVSTNNSTAAVTVDFRNGGVSGNQAVSVTASTTGYFQDLTHSDTFASGDLINTRATGAVTGGVDLDWIGLLITGPVSGGSDTLFAQAVM